jgi:hypothetical protein
VPCPLLDKQGPQVIDVAVTDLDMPECPEI